ncbi:MAG: methyltransferase domain-containing protein [Deltaproteobacteria bacterium]|nr:methyltransferase domain-containing protein [Deltaproteobacteria bacterium]
MSSKLIMLPEAYPVARLLCEYLFDKGLVDKPDLLILKKQRNGFDKIIKSYPFDRIYELDEKYYGSIRDPKSKDFLNKKMKDPYDVVYFPLNTFGANAFLFGSAVAKKTTRINSSLYKKEDVLVETFNLDTDDKSSYLPWKPILSDVIKTRDEIVPVLLAKADEVTVSGERPTLGIIEGFGHDLEIFCKYALASMYSKGKKVLDIGGGMGYGSFLVSRYADKMFFLDKSPEVVEIVKKLWGSLRPNLEVLSGDLDKQDFEDKSLDVVILMDVIEHIEEPEKILLEIKRLLKDDGVLIITTPEQDYYPYTVCPKYKWGEPEDKLLSEAIWPWHIQALGEKTMLPLLKKTGFKLEEKSYTTYTKGYELKRELKNAVKKGAESVAEVLNNAARWGIEDFSLTRERDIYFSAASYNIIVRKDL